MVKAKKRKKKTKPGKIVFAVFMILWTLALCAAVYFGLTLVHKFGEYWEASQITPKIDAYMDRLSQEIWKDDGLNSITGKIAELEHPYQTDEECEAAIKTLLQDDLRYSPSIGKVEKGIEKYDIFCGSIKLGKITVRAYPFDQEENSILNWAIEKFELYRWEVDEQAEFSMEDIENLDGLYSSFEITVPSSFGVVVNGHKLTEENIVERGIPYDCLKEYYNDPSLEAYAEAAQGLPTKVTYRAEKILGQVPYELLDKDGQPARIDPDQDDSQFIEPISDALLVRFEDFSLQFTRRYLEFCAGTGDMWYQYNLLKGYMVPNSELWDRLYRMIDSYLDWTHNENFNFNGMTFNGAIALGNNIYILDVSADAGSQMPAGYKQEHRDMKIYVLYDPARNELFAFSERDYSNNGAANVG